MGKQYCIASHYIDAEICLYFAGMMTNWYLRVVIEYLRRPIPGPTVICEGNHPVIGIMLADQITGHAKHMAVLIAMIQEAIRAGNSIPKKIKGTLNPSDTYTKPNPATALHCHFRLAHGHQMYLSSTSEHDKLMQLELVNQCLTEFDSAPTNVKFYYHRR